MGTILIAFDSTQQAIRAETLLEYADIEIDTLPTPKQVTAGCALSIEFSEDDFSLAKQIIEEQRVEIKGFYRKEGEVYTLLEM
ncbi:hypothetical protein BEP19_11655 [Ammoniphilus oxalaticus]|uniref:Putative Se/S carrier protein-like domain-containing protein n=1 Tax=Ammoniphilus oxalaticus TaxID=66863 RepID=A0A419SGH9_9BACL|nr:DUF3343 domain-containing protein [Ammoniphilus oxalaticus]RKD22886.1 hypothetical protein BEP19_11655 [Ammoniphilus oxalaticus]